MFYVLKRTWFAGADPAGAADSVKQVGATDTLEAAEAWAASLAQVADEPRFDPDRRAWRARSADALHEFHITDHPPARRR